MFATLVCLFIFLFIVFNIGNYVLIKLVSKEKENYSFFDVYFFGLAIVSSFLIIWSLFLPTNYISLLLLFILAIFFFYKSFKYYKTYLINKLTNKYSLIIFILLLLGILCIAIVLPQNYDTNFYHVQAILWNENYRVVPGLANFYDRLGFNSSIFVINAVFSFTFLYQQMFFVVVTGSFFMFTGFMLRNILFQDNIFKKIFLFLFIFYFTQQYLPNISSPDADILSNIIFSYLIITLILDYKQIEKKYLLFITLPLYCVTIKLSTLPIVLLCISIFFFKFSFKNSLKFLSLSFVIFLLPWLIRNIIISGYIIYPNATIDVFNFDWKVPIQYVEVTKNWVYSWGRIPFKYYEEVLSHPLSEWTLVWWNNALFKTKVFMILCSISPIITILIWKKFKTNKFIFLAFIISLFSFLLWFFSAPDIRFSYGVILLLALFPIALLTYKNNKFQLVFKTLIVLFLVNFTHSSYELLQKQYYNKSFSTYIYLPKDYYYLKYERRVKYDSIELNTKKGKKLILYSAIGDTNTYDNFPCTTNYKGGLQLRGEDLQSGFKKQ
jgi:hypothetical protein